MKMLLQLHRWDETLRHVRVKHADHPWHEVKITQSMDEVTGKPTEPSIGWGGYGKNTTEQVSVFMSLLSRAVELKAVLSGVPWERAVLPEDYDTSKDGLPFVDITAEGVFLYRNDERIPITGQSET